MATFRGAIRSYGAAVRRAERENKRRAREAAMRFKEQQRAQELEDAREAVEKWNEYVYVLKNMHKECTDPINWQEFLDTEQPIKPQRSNRHTLIAQRAIDSFRPSFLDRICLDKLFSTVEKKKRKLSLNLEKSIEQDESEYLSALEKHNRECDELEYLQNMARGVLSMDLRYNKIALDYFDPFSDIGYLGSHINLEFESKRVDAVIHVHSDDLIPDCVLSLTSSGKLSKKKMSKSEFNELYQDHVCSAMLRIAREIFNYLPVPIARISAASEMLNTQTGYVENHYIVSAIIPRQTLDKMNLEAIDPSDSMKNFLHSMKFKKTEGFQRVERENWPLE